MEKGYVWYSHGSDETGIKLAEALGLPSGSKTPKPEEYGVIIGWGCKPGNTYAKDRFQKAIAGGTLRLVNPVEAVQNNRNKLGVMKSLVAAKVAMPGFIALVAGTPESRALQVREAMKKGQLAFPILGLNENNKGAPRFCYTEEDILVALKGENKESPIHYFRSYCPGTEYRLHVFRDRVICAQVKELAKDPTEACAASLASKLAKRRAGDEKLQKEIPEALIKPATLKIILGEVAEDLLTSPNHIQKSVSHGWDLKDIEVAKVPAVAFAVALQAVEAVGLDMGAVSVSVDGATARVTAIATAPALSPAQQQAYVDTLNQFINSGSKAKAAAAKAAPVAAAAKASPEVIARLAQRLEGLPASKAAKLLALLED